VTPTSRSGRETVGRPWSAIVVAVVGIAIIAFGLGGRLVTGPAGAKGPNPSSTSSPIAAVASVTASIEPVRTAGPLPAIPAADVSVVDVTHDAESFVGNVLQPLGTTNDPGTYTFTIVCSGPGDVEIVGDDGSGVDPSLTASCDGVIVSREIEVTQPGLGLNARSSASAGWHVVVSTPAVAEESPQPTPAPTLALVEPLPCGSTDGLNAPPGVSIVIAGRRHPGVVETSAWNDIRTDVPVDPVALPAVTLTQARPTEIRTEGDACALAWQIEAQSLTTIPDPVLGPIIVMASHDAASADAGPAALNRFPIDGLSPGEWILRATLTFDRGSEVAWWRVNTKSVLFGRASLTSGGLTTHGLDIGCPEWQVAGTAGGDQCGPIPWPIDRTTALRVVGDTPIEFAIPGWSAESSASISSASAARSAAATGQPPEKITSAQIQDGRFTLPYGDLAILVDVHATRPGAEFGTAFLFHVVHVRP
jgi:hypothetical protein